MPLSDLCTFCAKINFEALRTPLLSDLPAIQDGTVDTTRHPFKGKTEDAHASTQLGKLSDIVQRAEKCRLCALIIKSLERHNGRRPQPEDVCRAETSYYGVYRDPRGKVYWTRRLSVSVRTPKGSWAHAFQPCNVGALSMEVEVKNRFRHKAHVNSMVFGGRRRPLMIDLDWVRQWIRICRTDHGEICEMADIDPGPNTTTIRFVDVFKRCVVTLEDISLAKHEYIALSYVWGGPQRVAMFKANKAELSQPGSLPVGHLPQTLEDAIFLARSLGYKHLWIDALCIVQDDLDDKKVQIGQMSRIYGFSSLTVIAATAKNANGGLPGLREGTRFLEQEEIVIHPESASGSSHDTGPAPLSLMTTLYPLFNQNDHYLEHTPWNERGWTMQERVMSRRVLVFMPEQVHWICREATFCEESYFESEAIRFNRFHATAMEPTFRRRFRNFAEPDDEELRLWTTYNNLVSKYTRRNFSFPGDVFDGFLCIMEGLTPLAGQEFLWGMPRSHFEQSLLWTSFIGSIRRTEMSTLPMTSLHVRITFPSWSWMGWVGEASVLVGDDRLDYDIGETPEIVCFEHHHNSLRINEVSPADSRFKSVVTSRPVPRWKQSNIERVTLSTIEENLPGLFVQLDGIPDGLSIFFWASTASFQLVPTVIHPAFTDGRIQTTANIVSSQGVKVGSVGSMPENEDVAYREGVHQFIVIGSRRNPYSDPVLLVLQVQWKGDIAYRINSAEIAEEAWENASPTWRLVALG